MHVITCTHPNISHVVIMVSRFMENLGKVHWHVVKWIFHYHRSTTYIGFVYDNGNNTKGSVKGFLDSYYADDLNKKRSLTSYVFTISSVLLVGEKFCNPLLPYLQQRLGIWH